MNPGSVFKEAFESHQFRSSDTVIRRTAHVFEHIIFTPDNARLSDVMAKDRVRRFLCYFLEQSAAMV
jgi:hypothetical protein